MKLLLACVLITFLSVPSLGADPVKEDAQQVAADNNAFAFDLYAKVRDQKGNLFFSPASISTALAMTYAGAKEKTAEEMAKVMHFTLGQEKLHPAFAALLKEMNGDGVDPAKRGYQLSVANALLFGQAKYPWVKEFLTTTKENYRSGLREVNYKTAHKEAREIINAWVEQETRDKIKDLIPERVLTEDTRLVLANAIYFKGDWAAKFDKRHTRDEKFFVTTEKSIDVPMMYRWDEHRIAENYDLQMLELPYKEKELSMLVLLPSKRDGIGDLEKSLSSSKLDEWSKTLRTSSNVKVWLPKFKIEQNLPITQVLQGMGLREALNPSRANLTGMGDEEKLFISAVLHKAFVEVSEEGTEAAAATAIVVLPQISGRTTPRLSTFRADHPFLFLIRDNRNGSILFMGRVSEFK